MVILWPFHPIYYDYLELGELQWIMLAMLQIMVHLMLESWIFVPFPSHARLYGQFESF